MRIAVVGAAIVRDRRCLVAQRSASMSAPRRWEFPGGKIEPGEAPEAALRRELAEELGISVAVGERIGAARAEVAGRCIELEVYWATLISGEPEAREHERVSWLDAGALAELDWADADVPIVPLVVAALLGKQPPSPALPPEGGGSGITRPAGDPRT